MLSQFIREALQREYCVLAGRGTTALFLALRAVAARVGPGEVIVPDMLCGSVLDGVLLAGFTPVFADVTPGRYTLDPASVARLVTDQTRAVLVAHLFGHIADMQVIRRAAPGITLVEDAVQGFGGSYNGQPAGTLGDLSFLSFDETKMIGGRAGVLLFDDPQYAEAFQSERYPFQPTLSRPLLEKFLPEKPAAFYAQQLAIRAADLLCPFDPSNDRERILADWHSLPVRVEERNAKAQQYYEGLRNTSLILPELRPGDAIWRYTITTTSVAHTRWITRHLQMAGLPGSSLYYPLSGLLDQQTTTPINRTVNLWVDGSVDQQVLNRTLAVVSSGPFYK